jgi:hypothetical protein
LLEGQFHRTPGSVIDYMLIFTAVAAQAEFRSKTASGPEKGRRNMLSVEIRFVVQESPEGNSLPSGRCR